MKNNKPFTTYRQQLKILRNRNIQIQNGGEAIRILKREGYYNIINGYKEIFLDAAKSKQSGEDHYKNGTTFEKIYALYSFDRAMKSVLLEDILRLETFLKSQIAYFFSEAYKQNFSYLDINNFDNSNPPKTTQLISKVSNVITKNSQSGQVRYYLEKHNSLPLWVLSKKMTFGEIYHFYEALEKPIQQKIINEFVDSYSHEYNLNQKNKLLQQATENLPEMLRCMNYFRNICAHDDRLFSAIAGHRKGTKIRIPNIILFHANKSASFKARLFDCILIVGFFATKKGYKQLCAKLEKHIDCLSRHIDENTFNDVLIRMGFPKNWKDEIRLP